MELEDGRLSARGVRLFLKRDDLIHAELAGNKWRKLKYNLAQAKAENAEALLTFGGAYSNHIRAVAAAGHLYGFSTVGVIRGEEHLPLNEVLSYAVRRGMRLSYLDRSTYRRKTEPAVVERLKAEFGDFYLVPEGGSNALALRGVGELVDEIDVAYDVICCPVGTGGTLAGIALALPEGRRAVGFSVLKGGGFLNAEVAELQRACGHVTGNWSIVEEFHFGGYAKSKPELVDFIEDFDERHGLRLEWVYVAKMMFGLFAMVDRGEFESGTMIVAIVTG